MSKYLTCGILYRIKNTDKFLIGHATKSRVWSIPKGIKDIDDADEAAAACRELREETSLILRPDDITHIGTYTYLKDKDICLFNYEIEAENAANISTLFCVSNFPYNYINKNGERKIALLPEIDKYIYVDIKNVKDYCNARMCEILEENVNWVKNISSLQN